MASPPRSSPWLLAALLMLTATVFAVLTDGLTVTSGAFALLTVLLGLRWAQDRRAARSTS